MIEPSGSLLSASQGSGRPHGRSAGPPTRMLVEFSSGTSGIWSGSVGGESSLGMNGHSVIGRPSKRKVRLRTAVWAATTQEVVAVEARQ